MRLCLSRRATQNLKDVSVPGSRCGFEQACCHSGAMIPPHRAVYRSQLWAQECPLGGAKLIICKPYQVPLWNEGVAGLLCKFAVHTECWPRGHPGQKATLLPAHQSCWARGQRVLGWSGRRGSSLKAVHPESALSSLCPGGPVCRLRLQSWA